MVHAAMSVALYLLAAVLLGMVALFALWSAEEADRSRRQAEKEGRA